MGSLTKSLWRAALAALALAFGAEAARADELVVQRHVTVRAAPARASDALDFPPVGSRLELLDAGARSHGYYHVRLPDGREGWIYQSFVRRAAGAEEAAAILVDPATDRMAVHYIDVEQGNAALLEFPCAAVLIDAGGRGEAAGRHLIDYLDAFFARRADLHRRLAAVFVTHTHSDHNSNLRRVAEAYEIGGYIHNGIFTGSGRFNAAWMNAHAADTPGLASVAIADVGAEPVTGPVVDPVACAPTDPKIAVLSGGLTQNPGWTAEAFKNGNNHSLVVRVDYGEASFLFPGDLEEEGIERLVGRIGDGRALDVDVYEVGHHGSHNGTTASLLRAMTPELAVISMGPSTVHEQWTGWQYGHPRRVAVGLIDEAITRRRTMPATVMVADGAKTFSAYDMTDAIYATGWDGDIVVTADAGGRFQIRTSRSP